MKKYITLSLVAVLGIGLQACKKEDTTPASSTSSGSMTVKMTDAPGAYTALSVEITKVEAFVNNKGWINLSSQSQFVNVLDLTNGNSTTIASANDLSVGMYSKLRLTFGASNSLVLNATSGGSTVGLSFTTETAKQVEIVIDEQVNAGVNTEVLLDFNVAQSIIEIGQDFIIQPAITEVENVNTGIKGEISGATQASIMLSNGTETYSTYASASGSFLIRGMEDGTYQLLVQGIRDGETQLSETSLQNVTVVEGQIKALGSIQL